MSTATKDVLYVDVDDEITTLIDRLGTSKHKIVALVLPKRASVLQSVVNMKLLKRAADEQQKHVVLITSEASLLPLAGAVGLHVAPTPNSKPAIPRKPEGIDDLDEESEITEKDFDPKASAATAVGALTGAKAANRADDNEDEPIQLDNDDAPSAVAKGAAAKTGKQKKAAKPKKGKNSKLKVPDFNAFRKKWLLIGGAVVLLLIVWVFGFMILPKATIAVRTDSEEINKRLDVTFDTGADSVDVSSGVIPSVVEQSEKVITQSVPATGQENRGNKATGEVDFSVSYQVCAPGSQPVVIPAGTGVSRNGLTYITRESVRLGRQGNRCEMGGSSDITAQAAGANYNVNKGDFTVAGNSSVSAEGSVSGGSDNIVKFVTQGDIDSLNQKLGAQADNGGVQSELASKLEGRDLFVVKDSFNTGTPETNVTAKVGDQTDTVNGTQKITYSMVGAKKQDIETFITKSVDENIDTSRQRVLNTGLDEATFKLQNQQNNSQQVQMSMNVTALAGPKLDDEKIKEQIAGKKTGEVRDMLKNYPGVTDVEVKLSPFWVTSVPKSASKITITYEK